MKLPALLAATLAASVAACGGSGSRPAPAPAPTHSQAGARTRADSDSRATPSDGSAQQSATRPDSAVSPSEVTTSALQIFGDSVAPAAPVEPAESTTSDTIAAGPTWDIDVRSYETQARVEKYIGVFTGPARETFTSWLQRGTRYDSMIRSKFRAGGLPEDMVYLALVESGYNPHAYSRSAAVGMWQFMASTARGTGLRVDWWVDERRDPVRSTDAALKFIGWLREQFGSLYLAAAAYNGGPGRVSRGLTRFSDDLEGTSGEDVFFALAEKDYLREETKNYVPQLIAAALIAKSPERYGIRVERLPAFAYDSVRVGPSLPLAAVARAARARTSEILDLNPHLLRGVTPPTGALFVRVPVGRAEGFDSILAAIPDEQRVAYTRVVSKKGDTMARLAARSGRSSRQLAWYNPKLEVTKKGKVPAGQTVLVPSAEVVAAAQDVPDPSIERYGPSKSGTTRFHVVKRGENLERIARRYGTTTARLKTLNRMRGTMIYPGQQLVVKGQLPRAARGSKAARRSAARTRSSRSASGRDDAALSATSAKGPRYSARDGGSKSGTAKGSTKKNGTKSSAVKTSPGRRKSRAAAGGC